MVGHLYSGSPVPGCFFVTRSICSISILISYIFFCVFLRLFCYWFIWAVTPTSSVFFFFPDVLILIPISRSFLSLLFLPSHSFRSVSFLLFCLLVRSPLVLFSFINIFYLTSYICSSSLALSLPSCILPFLSLSLSSYSSFSLFAFSYFGISTYALPVLLNLPLHFFLL